MSTTRTRGWKRHHQQVDAEIRAAAREFAAARVAAAAAIPRPEPEQPVVEVPTDARFVRTVTGWHQVVRVNAKTVTVRTEFSWDDRIAHRKVLQVIPAPVAPPGVTTTGGAA
jgi:hypothetical protein